MVLIDLIIVDLCVMCACIFVCECLYVCVCVSMFFCKKGKCFMHSWYLLYSFVGLCHIHDTN